MHSQKIWVAEKYPAKHTICPGCHSWKAAKDRQVCRNACQAWPHSSLPYIQTRFLFKCIINVAVLGFFLIFKNLYYYFILHVWVFCLHGCLCVICVLLPTGVKKGVRSPRTGATDGCKLPCECLELNLCPLKSSWALNHWVTSSTPIKTKNKNPSWVCVCVGGHIPLIPVQRWVDLAVWGQSVPLALVSQTCSIFFTFPVISTFPQPNCLHLREAGTVSERLELQTEKTHHHFVCHQV